MAVSGIEDGILWALGAEYEQVLCSGVQRQLLSFGFISDIA